MMRLMGWLRLESVEGKAHAAKWGKAQTMTEYAMVVALIAVVVYAAYLSLGKNVSSLVTKTGTSVSAS